MSTQETLRMELIEELSKNNRDFLTVRMIGKHAMKGLYLGKKGWRVEKDELGTYVLLPPEGEPEGEKDGL